MTLSVAVSSFISGLIGAMGFGGGSVLIIYLTLFAGVPQLQAQGTNLLFFIPCAVISVALNIRNGLVRYKTGVFIVIGGMLGLFLGTLISTHIPSEKLSKLFGLLVLVMGILGLFGQRE